MFFVAEFGFWDGAEKFGAKIEQLLSYATWRDSKLALIVFNRGRQMSDVLAKIREVLDGHQGTKARDDSYRSESGLRYILRHRDDSMRELIITVLAFDVPS